MTDMRTPEEDLRRYYPHLGERLDRLPFAEIAQHALEIEREMKPGETIRLQIRRESVTMTSHSARGVEHRQIVSGPSEALLVVQFDNHDRSIEYSLVAPTPDGPGIWMAIQFR